MFKPIPGNNEYIISLTQDMRNLDGKKVDIPIVDNKVNINIYNEVRNIDLGWLSLIAHFEVYLPNPSFKDLGRVRFVNSDIKHFKSISGKIMVFNRPFVIKNNNKMFRIIPCFTNYAISCDGVIIELASLKPLKIISGLKRHNVIDYYPSVYLYNPERSSYKYVNVHRLVALAWVYNKYNDFESNSIVNHIDGDKQNYYYKNLEWCNFSHNRYHAVNTGLSSDNIRCKIRDFYTGVVREFNSLKQAAEYMGLIKRIINPRFSYDVKGRLINKRYEMKLIDDTSPWFYENRTEKVKLGRYIITSVDSSGNVEYFHDTRDFKSRFKLWNCPNVKMMIKRAKNENPGFKFDYIDNYPNEIIQGYDVKNKTIIETKTITAMSKKLNISENTIRHCLRSIETRVKEGYAFRYKTDKEWDTNFVEHKKIQFRILAVNLITKEELKFDSLRHASRYLTSDRTAIKNSLINGFNLGNWKLTEIKE